MYGTAEVILHPGQDAVYSPQVIDEVEGIECNGWTVTKAMIQDEGTSLVLTLEGPIPFNIIFMDKVSVGGSKE